MRVPALTIAIAFALAGCGSDDNTVTSGFPGVIISPVRSSISAAVIFTDSSNVQHPQWVVAMTDAPNLCAKVTANPTYFQTATENFSAILFWFIPGQVGAFFVGTSRGQSSNNTEVVLGSAPAGGTPAIAKFSGVTGFNGEIVVSQFNTGAGGQAIGNFDVVVADGNGFPRELLGKFKATYCTGFEQAKLP
jgi:hypothetical protein